MSDITQINVVTKQIKDFTTITGSLPDNLDFATQLDTGGLAIKIPFSQMKIEIDARINLQKNVARGIAGIDSSSNWYAPGKISLARTNDTPLALLDIVGGSDASGSFGSSQVSFSYYGPGGSVQGFRHFVKTWHDGSTAGNNNKFQFYANNSSTASASTAPQVGNILVFETGVGGSYIMGPVTQGLGTAATTLTANDTLQFIDSAGVLTARWRNASGVSADLTIGGGSPSPQLTPALLNLGSELNSTQKAKFTATNISSAIVHYDPNAVVNNKFYAWEHLDNGYGFFAFSDDLVNEVALLQISPNSTTIADCTLVWGGGKIWSPNFVNFGQGNGPTITDSILSVAGAHQVLNYSGAAAGGKCYDIFQDVNGEVNFNRIDDAGATVLETVMKFVRFDANTTNIKLNGSVTTTSVNSSGSVSGSVLLADGVGAYASINNTNAATDLKRWTFDANDGTTPYGNGTLTVTAWDDTFKLSNWAMRATRSANPGSAPTITGVFKYDNLTTWSVTSDIRTKVESSIRAVDSKKSLDIISKVKVVNYQHTEEFAKRQGWVDNKKIFIGAIAQHLKDVCEGIVNEGEELSINIDPLIWHSINAIGELLARVESIESKIIH